MPKNKLCELQTSKNSQIFNDNITQKNYKVDYDDCESVMTQKVNHQQKLDPYLDSDEKGKKLSNQVNSALNSFLENNKKNIYSKPDKSITDLAASFENL